MSSAQSASTKKKESNFYSQSHADEIEGVDNSTNHVVHHLDSVKTHFAVDVAPSSNTIDNITTDNICENISAEETNAHDHFDCNSTTERLKDDDPNLNIAFHQMRSKIYRYCTNLLQQQHVQSRLRISSCFLVYFILATPSLVARIFLTVSSAAWKLILTSIGTTIGVGMGLGLATFVRDELERLSLTRTLNEIERHTHSDTNTTPKNPRSTYGKNIKGTIAFQSGNDDDNTYAELMASAGYSVPSGLLRGQILHSTLTEKNDNTSLSVKELDKYRFLPEKDKRNSIYKFPSAVQEEDQESKGRVAFKRMWPNLPSEVQEELGVLVDYIVRDYIACWFSSVDESVAYEDEKERRKRLKKTRAEMKDENVCFETEQQFEQQDKIDNSKESTKSSCDVASMMILSTTPKRMVPFLETIFTALASLLGNIATSASENVNLFELVLVKFLHIIKLNIKVYRELRRVALDKQMNRKHNSVKKVDMMCERVQKENEKKIAGNFSSTGNQETFQEEYERSKQSRNINFEPSTPESVASEVKRKLNINPLKKLHSEDDQKSVSEITMVREYLLSGKLHKAITFGMDVPSLLFSDQEGKVPVNIPSSSMDSTDTVQTDQHTRHEKQKSNCNEIKDNMNEDEILENRLFSSTNRVIRECELDYNRLFSHRLCRVLLQRSDFGSPMIRSVSVEILSACVLSPLMGCFSPEVINNWIINFSGNQTGRNMNVAKEKKNGKPRESHVNATSSESQNSTSNIQIPKTDDSIKVTRTSSEVLINQDRDKKDTDVEMYDSDSDIGLIVNVSNVLPDNSTLLSDDKVDIERMMLQESDELCEESEKKTGLNMEELEDYLSEEESNDGNESDQIDCLSTVVGLIEESCSISEDEEALNDEESNGYESKMSDISYDVDPKLDSSDFGLIASGAFPKQEAPSCEDISKRIFTLLTISIINLQSYIDFDYARNARKNNLEIGVNWNNKECCEVVRKLVLVIEVALTNGMLPERRKIKSQNPHDINIPPEDNSELTRFDSQKVSIYSKHSTLTEVLMEITSNVELFEEITVAEEKRLINTNDALLFYENEDDEDSYLLTNQSTKEISTMRTLIAAWLHTGLVFRIMSVFIRSKTIILSPFYHRKAFIRNDDSACGFVAQLKAIDEVDVLVDTMSALASDSLDLSNDSVIEYVEINVNNTDLSVPSSVPCTREITPSSTSISARASNSFFKSKKRFFPPQNSEQHSIAALSGSIKANFENNKKRLTRFVSLRASSEDSDRPREKSIKKIGISPSTLLQNLQNSKKPSHLEFHKNKSFASNLRGEREIRMKSYNKAKSISNKGIKNITDMICRSRGATDKHLMIHRDLHSLAKCFLSSSNTLRITSSTNLEHTGILSSNQDDETNSKINGEIINTTSEVSCDVASLTVETIPSKRKIEVPDDDSSFLLRAQPRLLNCVSVHKDQHHHDLSYKYFTAYYDEAVAHPVTKGFSGGRFQRSCYLKYFPSDNTASVSLRKDKQRLDVRSTASSITQSYSSFLPKDFEEGRFLCNKSYAKGSERSGGALSVLDSPLMEVSDFISSPRSGRAIDFIYRINLFENPVVEINSKKFYVTDSQHQSCASSLEVSDASICYALLAATEKLEFADECRYQEEPFVVLVMGNSSVGNQLKIVKSGKKSSSKKMKYKISFIRAVLLMMSSRKEAQLQCLLSCVKYGSARNATKARTDAYLKPTLCLLDFATSKTRDKQYVLLRDLKLGINHIDVQQLIRNGILNPRYPTILRRLKIIVESTVPMKSNQNIDLLGSSSVIIMYRIRCIAISEYIGFGIDKNGYATKGDANALPKWGDLFQEEWIILRSFRDFSALHKHLKTQVAASESSAGTRAKLVGAATGLVTAPFASGNGPIHSTRRRKNLIPSLGQASKACTLGETKKSIEKRRELLNKYLNDLLSQNNLLRKCPELLQFLGAHNPFPKEVTTGGGNFSDFSDEFGRSEMSRILLASNSLSLHSVSKISIKDDGGLKDHKTSLNKPTKSKLSPAELSAITSIKSRIAKVKVRHVRNGIFDLIRCLFDLDNASFFRSHLISALKTMTVAVTSDNDFSKMALEFSLSQLNGKKISEHIKYGRGLIWPDGVLFQPALVLSATEKKTNAIKSKEILLKEFPDQLKAVLGQEMSVDGVNILHEMLQNRVVLKSMMYMLMETLWLEIFPELGDILNGAQVLDA